eukprot:sb/3475242/
MITVITDRTPTFVCYLYVVVECSSASGSQYSPLHLVDSASLPSFLFRSSGCRNEVSVPQRLVPYPGPRLAAGRLGGGTPLYQLYGTGLFTGSRTGKCFRTITSLGYPYCCMLSGFLGVSRTEVVYGWD